jgi:hypothetical protein
MNSPHRPLGAVRWIYHPSPLRFRQERSHGQRTAAALLDLMRT